MLGKVGRGRVAVLQALGERLHAGLLQLWRDIANNLTRGLRIVVLHLPQQLPDVTRPEWQVSAKHLVKHDAQAVNVGAAVDAMGHSRDLLRRHVRWSAGDGAELAAARRRFVEAQSEVYKHRAAIWREDDVRGFDIAMNG